MAESRLDREPGLDERIATLLVDGWTHQEIANEIGAERSTVSRAYSKDPRVRAHIKRLHQDRTDLVARTIDKRLEGILTNEQARNKLSVKELLEIRVAMLGPAAQRLTLNKGIDEGGALAQLYLRAQTDPRVAAALEVLGVSEGVTEELPELGPGDD